MSEFNKILQSRNLHWETGQSIWKFNISVSEFKYLKESFNNIKRLSQLEPKDCAIYFAEWWKNTFNGGYPSKEEVYNSLELYNPAFDSNDFYESAKKGGFLLNYKWIKIQNTHYLKTLLFQGGLPLNHIKNNSGNYRNFLLKIIYLNPNTIQDFSANSELTSLLPISSQNEIIYNSCLEIVRAVLDNNENEILSFKANEDLKEITEALISERDKVRKKNDIFKFKCNFNSTKDTFFLNTTITSKIGFEEMNYILNDQIIDYQNEYKLFVGSDLIAKFIKRNDETYKVIQFKNHINLNDDFEVEIYLIDSYDKIYDANHLLHSKLNLDYPSLWLTSNDGNFVMEKSRHTNNSIGYVFSNQNYSIEEGEIIENIEKVINSKSFSILKFENVIKLTNIEGNTIKFKTKTDNIFDWTIISETPKWVVKSNLNIVKDSLRIFVYYKNGERISNPTIKWKSLNKNNWNQKNDPLELGILDVKISHDGIDEFERVFNIGNLYLSTSSDYNNPKITVNNNAFILEVYKSKHFEFKINKNEIDFKILNTEKFPTTIKTRIKTNNQSYGLIAEVISPFQGVILVDEIENIIKDDVIFFDKIKGWRLITNSHGKDYEVRFSNNKNKEITISKKIERKIKPLFEFYDTIKSLFQLYNIIDADNFLNMEIFEIGQDGNVNKKRSIKIKQFSEIIKWEVIDENKIKFDKIDSIDISSSVYALPLECDLEYIEKVEIKNDSDLYSINTTNANIFILFSDKNSKFKIKPEFISVNPENILTTTEDRNLRISGYSEQLLKEDYNSDVWNKFWIYYYLCRENDLPYTTLDIIKSITTSSELAAKAFAFLSEKFDNKKYEFSGNDFQELENDLGFSFHWVKYSDWEKICENRFNTLTALNVMLSTNWNLLKGCLFQNHRITQFVFKTELNSVRQRLGERVLSQLPFYDIENDRNKYIKLIPKKTWTTDQVNILVVASLTVASSIRGIDTGIWHVNGDNFRRKIKYIESLDKKWYEESLIYYLN